jgi:phosphatidylglycerophosphate synthase
MNIRPAATDDLADSIVSRYAFARGRLSASQKPTASVPAYLRFVNRRAGGLLASLGYAFDLTPTQVTLISSASSFAGIAVLIGFHPSIGVGILTAVLLLLGYALDSADGQLARVRGGGSKAGEWLDHVADIAKISILHCAVAVAILRYFHLGSWLYLLVPVVFLVTNVTQFFGMMLRDKLTETGTDRRQRPSGAGSSSIAVSIVLLPLDHGVLCLIFLTLGLHTVFLLSYGFLALCTVTFASRSLAKAYRSLAALDAAAGSR